MSDDAKVTVFYRSGALTKSIHLGLPPTVDAEIWDQLAKPNGVLAFESPGTKILIPVGQVQQVTIEQVVEPAPPAPPPPPPPVGNWA